MLRQDEGAAGREVMEMKLFEIRDKATFIPAMAIKLRNRTPEEFWLLRHAGYAAEQIGGRDEDVEPYVILCKLDGVEAHYDSFDWPNQRTMGTAHRYIIANWRDLTSSDVVDVQFILGETIARKRSEREE
ncbi:MAG: hypothetical protein NUV51_04520 [Sulfuricaulis sp.]|nr:hypothetical protein [Sulfuricaulis sp.]